MTLNTNAQSAIVDVTEMSADELDAVNGGIAPVVIYAVGLAVGFGLAALADYLDGGFND